MSQPNPDQPAGRMAAAAANVIAKVRYGWLATSGGGGLVNARPMGRTPRAPGDDEWTVRFVTDDRSGKMSEIRDGATVTLTFEHAADGAYVSLCGEAAVRPGAAADAKLWREAYEVYFPHQGDRDHAAFLQIRASRMALWIRGVTPEPFGLKATILERDASGSWRLRE